MSEATLFDYAMDRFHERAHAPEPDFEVCPIDFCGEEARLRRVQLPKWAVHSPSPWLVASSNLASEWSAADARAQFGRLLSAAYADRPEDFYIYRSRCRAHDYMPGGRITVGECDRAFARGLADLFDPEDLADILTEDEP